MTPDYERAATKATETLIHFGISTTPIDPLPMLKNTPNVYVMTFSEMSEKTSIDRCDIIRTLGQQNQDAITTVFNEGKERKYIVSYNMLLPSKYVDRALARELGHIVLDHDGSRPEEVRDAEARCFAHHLLCPRPLIHSIQATGIRFTVDMLGSVTGCYDYCLSCMRKLPPVHTPADLNRHLRDQFKPYLVTLFEFLRYASLRDGSALADMGSYMEGYEE